MKKLGKKLGRKYYKKLKTPVETLSQTFQKKKVFKYYFTKKQPKPVMAA
jgi:hypothetical protein